MIRLTLVSMLFTTCASMAQPAADRPFASHQLVEVSPHTPADLMRVTALSTSIWSCRVGLGPIQVQVSPEQLAALEDLGMPAKVLIPDVQAAIEAEATQIAQANIERANDWFVTYRTLAEINARMETLAGASNGLAQTFSIGLSLEGREIRGIRFSGPDEPGNLRSNRPAVLFAGGIHAREWISPMTVMYIADRMIENRLVEPQIAALLRKVEVIVIPVQNVDGYFFTWASPSNRLWRKNRRNNGDGSFGVDLNRNYGTGWGLNGSSGTPGNDTYRGPTPFSEPESQVMRDFMIANPRLKASIDYHSFSQLVLTPWGYQSSLPADAQAFNRISSKMVTQIGSAFGSQYTGGPTFTTIYPASGVVQDWAYGERGLLGIGVELRDTGATGFLLPAEQILPTAQENFLGAFAFAEFAGLPLLLSSSSVNQVTLVTGVPSQTTVQVRPGTTTVVPESVRLFARLGSSDSFQNFPTSDQLDGSFSATLPVPSCGQVVEWYFVAEGVDGSTNVLPEGAPASVFRASAEGRYITYSDDMEADRGWTAGLPTDDATAGRWERANPQATGAQPENDASPNGEFCFITGATAGANNGSNDLDGGITTLISPRFSAAPPLGVAPIETLLTLSYWYSNNLGSSPNADSMLFDISNDDGATWDRMLDLSSSTNAWVSRTFLIPLYVEPTNSMRLRFTARDLGAGSLVEAAIDDVVVSIRGCRTADFNGDGGVDGDDVIAYFAAWDQGSIEADYSDDAGVDGDDVIVFFALWDSGR